MRPLLLFLLLLTPLTATGAERGTVAAGPVRFEYGSTTETMARKLAKQSPVSYRRLCSWYEACPKGPFLFRLFSTLAGFSAAQPGEDHIDWASGMAYPEGNLALLRTDGSVILSIYETFDHELSHLLLYSSSRGRVPRWYAEGLAILQAGESLEQRITQAAGASLTDSLFPLEGLARAFGASGLERNLAYAQSALFVRWLFEQKGQDAFKVFHSRLAAQGSFSASFNEAFDVSLDTAFEGWKKGFSRSGLAVLLMDDWWLWSLVALVAVAAAGVAARRRRKARKPEPPEEDWEYKQDGDNDEQRDLRN